MFRAAALAALLLAPSVAAQGPAVRVARAHLAETAGVTPDAIGVADIHTDRASGAEIVHLVQLRDGVPVWGTLSAVAVLPDGRAVASGHRLVSVDVARAGASEPAVPPAAAVAAALAAVPRTRAPRTRRSDAPGESSTRTAAPLRAIGAPALVYQPIGDALHLAWAVTVAGDAPTALWAVRVDAHTGAVLAADDLVARETIAPTPTGTAPPASPGMTRSGGPAYRVIPFPFAGPQDAPFTLVQDPASRGGDASPFGWHDTDGSPGPELTVTDGNNVSAYADADDNNAPDPGSQPDGGPGLVFDFPFDPEQPPGASRAAAVTNAFYWGNVLHDVLWAYGFDEPAGNFQHDTYGRGGVGNDRVNLEVQDGNPVIGVFATPSDGSRPRMEMDAWLQARRFTITAPAEIAGDYPAAGAAFGAEATLVSGDAVVVRDADDALGRGCTAEEVANADAVGGAVAVVERGACSFVDKARVAQALGAVGVAVYNCEPGPADCSETISAEGIVTMACPDGQDCSDVTLPAVFVARSTGLALADAASPQAEIEIPVDRDAAYDSGLIAYLYGQGVVRRLVGGPSTTSCLQNEEQMLVGWADWLALMMTMQPGDTGAMPRVPFAYIDPTGSRPTPYSTDFAVNDATYQDVIDATLSVPHGVGYVWASVLWDVTWALVEREGLGSLYDADGGAGNQVALRLGLAAMKLLPCEPGFVDARDALFAADELLYDGFYFETIATAFSPRGLGPSADQGSPDILSDGTADFTPYFFPAVDPDADGGPASLVVTGANPVRETTTLALHTSAPETVSVDLLDARGRRVARLYDGDVVPDAPVALRLDAKALPAGVYVVRAVGETFRLTERVTVLR